MQWLKNLIVRLALSFSAIGATIFGCEMFEVEDIDPSTDSGDIEGITNGTATNWDTWKGVVGFYNPNSFCTGAMIDPRVVLTAGHCVYWPDSNVNLVASAAGTEILGGANLATEGVLLANAVEAAKHPEWNCDFKYEPDLGLILLDSPVEGVECYGIRDGALPEAGDEGVLVGYGNNNTGGGDGVHRAGETTILQVNSELMELGNPAGHCYGDSGGPFFTEVDGEWVVTGVNSYGSYSECATIDGNWDVTVQTYRNWIEQQVKEWTGHGLECPGGTSDSENDSDYESDNDSDDSYGASPDGYDSAGCSCSNTGAGQRSLLIGLLPIRLWP